MTSTVAVAYSHPTATEQQVEDLLWSKALAVAVGVTAALAAFRWEDR